MKVEKGVLTIIIDSLKSGSKVLKLNQWQGISFDIIILYHKMLRNLLTIDIFKAIKLGNHLSYKIDVINLCNKIDNGISKKNLQSTRIFCKIN